MNLTEHSESLLAAWHVQKNSARIKQNVVMKTASEIKHLLNINDLNII